MSGSTFQVGLQSSLSSLKNVASGLPSGVSVWGNSIVINQAGAVLDGYDLRGYTVSVESSNVTIKNSLLNATGYHTIYQSANASGMLVEFNTFDGEKANGTINGDMVLSENVATISNNEFFNLPADGVNTTGGVIEHNYFSGASYQTGAHADAISVHRTVAPVTIRENYIDFIKPTDAAQGTNSAVKIVSHFGTISDVTIEHNIMVGGGFNSYVGQDKYAVTNVRMANNRMGLSEYGDKEGQFVMPGDHGTGFAMTGNSLFSTAAASVGYAGPSSSPGPTPSPPFPVPPASDLSTITLHVSGDQYQGLPQFNLLVDGAIVATDVAVSAQRGNGEWADITITGHFSKTPHQVAVTFTNDVWVSSSQDRNLYVDYIDVNGHRYEGEAGSSNTANPTPYSDAHAALMLSNGTLTFTTGTSAPPSTGTDPHPTPSIGMPSTNPLPLHAPVIMKGSNGANTMHGTAGRDAISGLGGNDKIKGDAGDDMISGGRGKDALWGGAGNDVFVFGSIGDTQAGAGRDVIYDWGSGSKGLGNDIIDLHAMDANLVRSGNQGFKWIGKAAFSGKAGELRTHFDGHDTIIEGNVDGDRAAEFQIKLIGKHALSAADFVL